MQGGRRYHRLTYGLLAVLAVFLPAVIRSAAAFDATKRYQVIPYEGRDLICEHYTFSSEEDPLAVFQQKGEISQTDFVRFLAILRKINPNIGNLLQPKPGESVLIPLRFETVERSRGEIRSLDVPMLAIPDVNAATRNAGIPPVAVSNPSRLEHVVQPGENLFRIVLRYFGPTGWQKRVERILEINPHVGGVNRLRAGERIVLDAGGPGQRNQRTEWAASGSSDGFWDVLKTAALWLKARLLASGDMYFPMKDGGDFRLDLRRYPLLEIPRQPRAVIDPVGDLKPETLRWIQGHGGEAVVITVSSDIRDVDVLVETVNRSVKAAGEASGHGAVQKSHVIRNPKLDAFASGRVVSIDTRDPKRAIDRLLTALGLRLQYGVQLSFPYAGTQIQTVCDLVETPSGKPLVIDFGDFGGDAAVALQACGFHVVSFSRQEDVRLIVRRLLKEIGSMAPDGYRVGPLTEAGVGADRIDLLKEDRAILLVMEPVASDRIENWLRDGFDVILLKEATG